MILNNRSRHILSQMEATCCLNLDEGLLKASRDGHFRSIRGILLCPNSDINVVDGKGRTPIYLSSMMGHIESVKVLLDNPQEDPNKGMVSIGHTDTAFSIASEKGHFKIMWHLLQHHETNVSEGWCYDNWTPHLSTCLYYPRDQITTTSQKSIVSGLAAKCYYFFGSALDCGIRRYIYLISTR